MKETIKSIFEEECKNLAIDVSLTKRLKKYQQDFVNKNHEHIEFFGGNTMGVQVVRFMPSDRDRWFDEILEVDDGPLGEALLHVPDVNKDWHVSSDTMNLSCAWLAHAIFISEKLNDKQKHEAMVDVFLILQYKYLTSILYHWFRYPADRGTAEATYASLSNKYAIKIYGSWTALLVARAEEIISSESIHYKTIVKLAPDTEVVYLLNDVQGRIKDIMRNIYAVFDRVHKQGIKISSTSSVTINTDGEEVLKDKSKSLLTYGRYLNSIVTDKNSFIHGELTSIIEKLIHTMPPKLFNETLEWVSDNYRQSGAGMIEEVINETLIHSFDYISHNRELVRNNSDLGNLLSKLKGIYMSSRSTDPALLSLREKSEKIVTLATGNKNDSIIASVRTGIMLYIVIRALTMRYYTSGT